MTNPNPQFRSQPGYRPDFAQPRLEADELTDTELDGVVGGLSNPLYVPAGNPKITDGTSNTIMFGETAKPGPTRP